MKFLKSFLLSVVAPIILHPLEYATAASLPGADNLVLRSPHVARNPHTIGGLLQKRQCGVNDPSCCNANELQCQENCCLSTDSCCSDGNCCYAGDVCYISASGNVGCCPIGVTCRGEPPPPVTIPAPPGGPATPVPTVVNPGTVPVVTSTVRPATTVVPPATLPKPTTSSPSVKTLTPSAVTATPNTTPTANGASNGGGGLTSSSVHLLGSPITGLLFLSLLHAIVSFSNAL